MADIAATLAERRSQHGPFRVHAQVSQRLKNIIFEDSGKTNAELLTAVQREALEMIAHKIGRIIAGDPNHIDHWCDIAGYATLVANDLEEAQKCPST